jgi:hypothetical protein
MASAKLKAFLAQELSAWTLEGVVDEGTAAVLRARWDEPGFGIAALVKYLGVIGGLLAVLGLLGLVGSLSESLAASGVLSLMVSAGFLWAGRALWRDPRGRFPSSSRAVLGLGVLAFALGVGLLAGAAELGEEALVHAVLGGVVLLTATLGYRFRIRFLVLVAVMAFMSWMGAWGGMWGRSSYVLEIADPVWMLAAATVVFCVGLWHERALGDAYPRFHLPYQVLGLLYANLSLLILTDHHFDTAGKVWAGVAVALAIVQIVLGARLLSALLTGFGVTFAVLVAIQIYCETLWSKMDRGLFFLVGGAALFALGFAFELRQKEASP